MKRQFILGIDASFTDSESFTRITPFDGDATQMKDGDEYPMGERITGMHLQQGLNIRSMDEFAQWVNDAEGHLVIRRREELESDPGVRQLLPYALILQAPDDSGKIDTAQGKLISYQRQPGNGEPLLTDKWSIGGGGHVDLADVVYDKDSYVNLGATVVQSTQRELSEEFKFFNERGERIDLRDPETAKYLIYHLGFLRDDTNKVGQVHLALVNILVIPHDWRVEANEDEIVLGEPATAAVLLSKGLNFENWSQILLEELAGVGKHVEGAQEDTDVLPGEGPLMSEDSPLVQDADKLH